MPHWLEAGLTALWGLSLVLGFPAMLVIGLAGRKPWPPFEEIGKGKREKDEQGCADGREGSDRNFDRWWLNHD